MIDVPSWPGVTLRSYQPARLWLASGGTWIEPSATRPSRMTAASTRSDGMMIRTGADALSAAAVSAAVRGGVVRTVAGTVVAPPVSVWADPDSARETANAPPITSTRPASAVAARAPGHLRRRTG